MHKPKQDFEFLNLDQLQVEHKHTLRELHDVKDSRDRRTAILVAVLLCNFIYVVKCIL